MIGFAFVVLLTAAAPQSKAPEGVRPMTQSEEEAAAIKAWESKEARMMGRLDAGAKVAPFRWKLSNVVRDMPIEGTQIVNDTPVKLHGVVVKGRLEDVLEELYLHFVRSGLYVQPMAKQDQPTRQLQVTAYDHDRSISYTAMVDPLIDGTCVVMLGEANIGEANRATNFRKANDSTVKGDFAPMMANASDPTRVRIEGMQTLSYQVKSNEGAVRSFYQEKLKKLGYAPAAEPDLFQKETEEIQLSMQPDKGALNVLLTKRNRARDRLLRELPSPP